MMMHERCTDDYEHCDLEMVESTEGIEKSLTVGHIGGDKLSYSMMMMYSDSESA